MPLSFTPSSINLPTPPSYAAAPMGSPVNPDALTALSELGNIQATRQGIATSQQALAKSIATFEPDVAKAEAEAKRATTEAQSANLKYNNEKINTYYTELSPYASDERVLNASKLNQQSTPEEIENVKNGLLDVGDETVKKLVARGIPKTEAYSMVAPHYIEALQNPALAAKNIRMAVQKLAGASNIAEQNQPKFEKNAAGEFVQITPARNQVAPVGGSSNPNPTSGGVISTNEYIKDLNARNAVALETDMRLGEAKGLLKTFKGGAGTRNFAEIARWAQSVNLPQGLVDSIAGGDISAVQSAQKFITSAVIQGATANPGTAESVNRFIKDNPDIASDPRTLERFINFAEKLNQKTFDETEFLLSQKKSGKFNPDTHVQEMQQHLRKEYLNPSKKEEIQSNKEMQSRKVVRTGIDKRTGQTVVEYDDGSLGYK